MTQVAITPGFMYPVPVWADGTTLVLTTAAMDLTAVSSVDDGAGVSGFRAYVIGG